MCKIQLKVISLRLKILIKRQNNSENRCHKKILNFHVFDLDRLRNLDKTLHTFCSHLAEFLSWTEWWRCWAKQPHWLGRNSISAIVCVSRRKCRVQSE